VGIIDARRAVFGVRVNLAGGAVDGQM
jgi:hypothetical protein